MPLFRLTSENLLTSLKVMQYYHNMAHLCNRSDCITKNSGSKMKGMQEHESIMGMRGREKKICPSGSQSDITRQAL